LALIDAPEIIFHRPDAESLVIHLSGTWSIEHGLPPVPDLQKEIASTGEVKRVGFDTQEVNAWDSSILTFLTRVVDFCPRERLEIKKEGLPEGVIKLLALASAVPEKKDARKATERIPFFSRIGGRTVEHVTDMGEMISFFGEAFLAFLKLFSGKAHFRRVDLVLFIQECGAQALPIVSLISVLVGLILAFVGAG